MFGFGDGGTSAPPPFTPSDVPNLELFLDGRDLVGADAASIATWAKRAGASGTDATQATAGNKPIIKSGVNGLNSLPVARFDGVDDFMRATFDAGSTGFTIYLVGRTGSALSSYGTLVGSGGSGGGADNKTPGIGWAFARGNSGDGFGAGWGGTASDIGLGDPSGIAINQAFRARYRTNKIAWSIQGPNSGTPADTSFPTGTFQCHIGCANTSTAVPQFCFKGDLAAILIFSRALSGPEDTNIGTYLQGIWGI